jgi:hypothetical protein
MKFTRKAVLVSSRNPHRRQAALRGRSTRKEDAVHWCGPIPRASRNWSSDVRCAGHTAFEGRDLWVT